MENLSKGSKNIYWVFLVVLVVLTSCVSRPNNQSIVLVEPKNASVGIPLNGQTFIFKGVVGTEYELIIKKDSTGETVFQKSVVPDTETFSVKIDNGKLAPKTQYRWYVRIKGNDSKASDLWRFTTKENSVPVLSNPSPNQPDQPFGILALAWDSSDADNDKLTFKIKVYEKGKDTPVYELTEVDTNTCVVKNLKQTTEYTWTVVAQDPWGGTSNEISATFSTKANEPPSNIRLVSPADLTSKVKFNNLLLKWEGVDPDREDLKYSLKIGPTSEDNYLVKATTETSFVVSDLKPGTLCTLEIVAEDSSGEKIKKVFNFTTKDNSSPTKPVLLDPTDNIRMNLVKVSTYTFKWSPSSDPDEDSVSYKLVILNDSNSTTVSVKPINDTSYTVNLKNIIEANKKYAWYVEAYDKHGGASASQKFYFETYFNNPPSKPTDPTPAVGTTQPNRISSFSWLATDKDGDSLKYDIYIGDSPSNLRLEAQDLPVNYYSTTRLFDFSKTYYWKVVVKDGVNDPVDGDIWWFKITNEDRPPTAPELVSPTKEAKEVAFNNLQLKWKASTDNEDSQNKLTYYVYQGKADNMTLAATITGQTSSEIVYGISNLSPITTYYWRIEVKDTFGNYAYSTTWSFTTKANTAPSIPSNPSPANNSSSVQPGTVTLTWEASDSDGDILSYEVYVDTTNDFTNTIPIKTDKPNCTFTVTSGKTYFWKVIAKDSHEGETEGPTWKFTVQ